MRKLLTISLLTIGLATNILAYPGFVGYSGAPAANGICSSSCHGQNDFVPTCQISGFPDSYIPGHQYLISVHHSGGPAIVQFNCSIRKDSDSTIAGLILSGDGTDSYSASNEANGVHWALAYNDSGAFTWTAPAAGAGHLTFYWAGLQGTRAFGTNQQIILDTREEGTSIEYSEDVPTAISLGQNYPNPFNQSTTIRFTIARAGNIVLEIANILGQRVYSITVDDAQPGEYSINWHGFGNDGLDLPSGIYFYQLQSPEGNLTRKMTIIR